MKGGNTLGTLRYGGTGRQHLKKLAAPAIIPSDQNGDFTYGQALRPPTPIKAVIGNFYGEIAGFQHSVKTTGIKHSDAGFRTKMLNPPKSHTRATAMANSYVNNKTMTKVV